MIKITDEMIKQLLIEERLTDARAAEKLSVSRMTVNRHRNRLKIPPKPKHTEDYYKLSFQQEKQLRELYAQGLNDYEVASRMHLGRNRLREWREKNNILSQSNKKDIDLSFCLKINKYLNKGETLE